MTVVSTNSDVTYYPNGVTTQFPVDFRFIDKTDLVVTRINAEGTESTLTLNIDYTVSGGGSASGGSVQTIGAPLTGGSLTITREIDPNQLTDLRNQGDFFAEVHEDVFDKLTMLIQQVFGRLGRAMLRPIGFNYYDAEGRQIKNVADPTASQDAANKGWAEQYISSILATGQGPINNALNVIYVTPSGAITTVASALDDVDGIARKIEDYYRPESYGAVGDGVNDDTAAFQECVNAASGIGVWACRSYRITSGIIVPPNTPIYLTGSVDMSGCPASAAAFSVSGSEGVAYALASNATVSSLTASLSPADLSASGISAGDWVRVCSDGIFDPARTSSKIGEIIRVESVDLGTGVVTFEAPLVDGYLTSDLASMSKITFAEGVRFEGGGTIYSNNDVANVHKCIQVNLAITPYIGPMIYRDFSDRAIWLQDSIHARVDQPYFSNSLSSGTGYGISVVNACQDAVITGLVSHRVRHAFSTNNNTSTKGIPRRIVVNGFVVDVSAKASGGSGGDAMDTHAAADEIHFMNGVIRGATGIGVNIECPTASVTNVSVYSSVSHGLNYQNFSARSGQIRISGFKSVRPGTDGVRITPSGAALDAVEISGVSVYDAAQAAVNINGNATYATRCLDLSDVTSYRHGNSIAAVLVTNVDRGQVRGVTGIDGTNVAGFVVRVRDSKNVNVSGVGGRLPSASTGGMVQFNGSASGLCSNNLADGVQGESPSAASSRGIQADNNCQNIVIGQNNDLAAFTTPISWGTGTGHRGGFLRGQATYDPPSVAAGGETSTTVTVTGASVGDLASAAFSLSLGGLRVSAEVTAANTVTVTLRNNTGSAIDIGSGTLRARVEKI